MANNPEVSDLLGKLSQMGANAAESDKVKEVGPGDVGPTVGTKPKADGTPNDLVSLEMSEEDMGRWWKEIEKAEQRRTTRERAWDILLDEYMPVVSKSGEAETVKVQAHFRNTHTKLGSLWYRSPEMVMQADDPGPGNDTMPDPRASNPAFATSGQQFPPITMDTIIAIKNKVLNKKLGRDGLKANRLMDELLFDVLQWSGIGVCKVGYQCTMLTIQVAKMIPDPTAIPQTQQYGSTLGLNGAPPPPMIQATDPVTQEPVMEPQEVPVYEEYYARRLSPKKYLVDANLRSTRVDEDATWVGMDFFLTPEVASEKFKIPVDQLNKAAEDTRIHEWKDEGNQRATGLVHCIEIWPKSCVHTPSVNPHPLAMNQLILIKGMRDKPAVWRPSPDQTFDKNGRLTADSITGFPIRVLTIRDLADSCFPPADAAHTNSDIKQMSTWRRQSIRIRDAAIGKYLYDAAAFGPTEVEALKNGDIGEYIPVEDGALENGVDKVFAQTSKITSTPDDARGFAGIKQDMNETLGIGANQAGTETDTVRTATEADKVASAVASRNDKELGRVIDFYIDTARMVDQFLMRYMTDAEYVEIAGDGAPAQIHMWDGKMISGKYLYDIAPDSHLRPDTWNDYKKTEEYYNLTAKDNYSNRLYVLRRMARMIGLDPLKATQVPQPPPPAMEPLKLMLSITVDDLEKPIVQALLDKFGPNIDPSVKMTGHAQATEHGGPADKAEPISEHMRTNSGGRQNAPGAPNYRANQVK